MLIGFFALPLSSTQSQTKKFQLQKERKRSGKKRAKKETNLFAPRSINRKSPLFQRPQSHQGADQPKKHRHRRSTPQRPPFPSPPFHALRKSTAEARNRPLPQDADGIFNITARVESIEDEMAWSPGPAAQKPSKSKHLGWIQTRSDLSIWGRGSWWRPNAKGEEEERKGQRGIVNGVDARLDH